MKIKLLSAALVSGVMLAPVAVIADPATCGLGTGSACEPDAPEEQSLNSPVPGLGGDVVTEVSDPVTPDEPNRDRKSVV